MNFQAHSLAPIARPSGRPLSWVVLCICAHCITGCVTARHLPPEERPTSPNKELAQPAYWMEQPAQAFVDHGDFEELWQAARRAARGRAFRLDRTDFRNGVMTTTPSISEQFFEIWRGDVTTLRDFAESSLATVRRTIRFDIERQGDQDWRLTPRVLVERFAFVERRITSVHRYTELFGRPDPRRQPGGFYNGLDRDLDVPESYWYADRRDADLEQALARQIAADVGQKR